MKVEEGREGKGRREKRRGVVESKDI